MYLTILSLPELLIGYKRPLTKLSRTSSVSNASSLNCRPRIEDFDVDDFEGIDLEGFEQSTDETTDDTIPTQEWWDYDVDEHEGCDVANLYNYSAGQHIQPDISKASEHFIGYNDTKGPLVRLKELMSPQQLALADIMTSMSEFLFAFPNVYLESSSYNVFCVIQQI